MTSNGVLANSEAALRPARKSQRFKDEGIMDADSERAAKAARENQQLIVYLFVASMIVLSWILGSLDCSFLWTFILIVLTFMVWWNKVLALTETYVKEKEVLMHRRRALRQSETAEWLNFVVNCW